MNKNKRLGFTLIELLIVIALLGILAVGLLAAIDPLEQFRKGQDTGARNQVQELYNGIIRFYAIHTEYPWGEGTFDVQNLTTPESMSMVSEIIEVGELKTNFLDNIQDPETIWVYGYEDPDSATAEHSVCFLPRSKSIKTDPNSKYDNTGSELPTGSCGDVSSNCYWCLR